MEGVSCLRRAWLDCGTDSSCLFALYPPSPFEGVPQHRTGGVFIAVRELAARTFVSAVAQLHGMRIAAPATGLRSFEGFGGKLYQYRPDFTRLVSILLHHGGRCAVHSERFNPAFAAAPLGKYVPSSTCSAFGALVTFLTDYKGTSHFPLAV